MSFGYVAPHGGTPIPGANPKGYMLGPTTARTRGSSRR